MWTLTYASHSLGSRRAVAKPIPYLYAHRSTQLHYVVRRSPFAAVHLADCDVTVDFSELTTPKDRVAVIATIPLTDNEQWLALPPNRITVFRDGAVLH